MHMDENMPICLLRHSCFLIKFCVDRSRVDSRLAPSQWDTPLQNNAVHHWLGGNLQSALRCICILFTLAFRSHSKLPYLQVLRSFTCKRLPRRLRITTKFLPIVQTYVWKWGCKCFMSDKHFYFDRTTPFKTGPKVKIYRGLFWPPPPNFSQTSYDI